ncbi:mitochondrial genome maintenance MGM101 [Xylariomycetidae sp. FL0641]|nr:mitochondrial genome maintenance MGM101 [Xylariomycetidae sp. FL0641]
MASRTLTPLRAAASRYSGISAGTTTPLSTRVCARRTLVSATKPRTYPQATTTTTTASSAAKPVASTPPPSTRTAAPTAAARTPIPAVSGTPLPDAAAQQPPDLSDGGGEGGQPIDWTNSYHGLGTSAFGPETARTLLAPLHPDDIEVKPDGIIYLPEIKYRRILNQAFGPGGWGLAPRGNLIVSERMVARDYALVVHGRFVAQARGEQQYFSEDGVSTAAEGCKSNALMRCCKDLGIASELWDPRFIRRFMKEYAVQQWVEHVTTKKRKQIWLRKDDEVRYPFKKT